METESISFFTEEDSEKLTVPKADKKRRHQVTEQKGRQKINVQITDLKNLLPECKYVMTTKASILECAVATIKRFQSLTNTLSSSNRNLIKENKKLHAELNRLRESGIFVNAIGSEDEGDGNSSDVFSNLGGSSPLISDCIPSIDPFLSELSPFEDQSSSSPLDDLSTFLPPSSNSSVLLSPSPSSPFVPNPVSSFYKSVVNVMDSVAIPEMKPHSISISNPDVDPFFLDYCSSPSISSPLSSSSSSIHSSPASNDTFSPFASPDRSEIDFDPSGFTRFTKRRLLFVMLFMIPMFVTLDKGTMAGDFVQGGTVRTILAPESYFPNSMEGWDFVDLWNIIRTIWYIVGGMAGAGWIFNTFMWANKLNEEYSYNENNPPNERNQKRSSSKDPSIRRKKAIQTTRRTIVM